jgi:hypothetical protein
VVDPIGFALYLPGIEMTLAAKLYSPDVGERQMLFEHLDKLRHNDILVLDPRWPVKFPHLWSLQNPPPEGRVTER